MNLTTPSRSGASFIPFVLLAREADHALRRILSRRGIAKPFLLCLNRILSILGSLRGGLFPTPCLYGGVVAAQ